MDEEIDFLLSASGLNNTASHAMSLNFTFIVGEKKYKCNSYFAEFISPKITKMHIENPKESLFKVDIDDPNNYFELVMDLLYGNEISANVDQSVFLRKVAKILENDELYEAFSFINVHDITDENVFAIFEERKEANLDTSEEVTYIASNFHKFSYDLLKTLPLETLDQILKSPHLLVTTEGHLCDFIFSLVKEKGEEYKHLFASQKFENLTQAQMKDFLEILTPDDLTSIPGLWDSLTVRLRSKCPQIRIRSRYVQKDIKIPYKPDFPFDGIFTYIRSQNDGMNPVSCHAVEMSVLNDECSVPISKILDYGTSPRWYLPEHEDNYFMIDFLEGRVSIDGFTFSSGTDSSYWEHPVSWTWEGSDNGRTWEEFDRRDDNMDMGGNEKTHTWKCKPSPFYRYIRFRLRNVTRRGGLYTTQLELFGAYEEPPKED